MTSTSLDLTEASTCLEMARRCVERAANDPAGPWQRGTPFLLRRGLEAAIDALTEQRGVTDDASMRAKLLCLPAAVPSDLAAQMAWLWGRLSGLCHYTSYRMDPPYVELVRDLEALDSLITELGQRPAG